MLLTQVFENNLEFFLPEFFLATAILCVVLYGSMYSVSKEHQSPLLNISTCWVAIFTLCITWILVFSLHNISCIIFNSVFVCDTLSQNTKLFILCGTIFCLLMNLQYVKYYKVVSFEYFLLILSAVLGLIFLCSSFDLISVYLALELQSLSLYVLASFNRESSFSTEAGLKYFILGAFSSALYLLGSSFIYGLAGSTNFEELRGFFYLTGGKVNIIQIGIFLITCSLLFKITSFPFHFWSPDVYDGSPLNSTTFFAIIPKLGLVLIFLRLFFFCFCDLISSWEYSLGFCSISSVIVGSFSALKQRKIKRLLAYSAVGHTGYILLAIASINLAGAHGCIIYAILYIVMGLGIWSIVNSLASFQNLNRTWTIADLSMFSKTNKEFSFSFIILFFSMAGIPPFSGFYAKVAVFLATISATFYLYSAIIILVNGISTFYYIRLIKTAYFEVACKPTIYRSLLFENSLILSFSCFSILFIFSNPNFLWLFTYSMALCLVG